VPSITVPPGATSATFTVGTNPVYRQYSGLAFTVTISVVDPSTSSTRSATLESTEAPRVRVRWPNGDVEEWPTLAIDRWTTLKEGEGGAR